MSLRNMLLKVSDPIAYLWQQTPETISKSDLVFLLRLAKCHRNNQLACLQLEAKWWVLDHRTGILLKAGLKDPGYLPDTRPERHDDDEPATDKVLEDMA